MPASIVVDAGFVVALLSRRDQRKDWALAQAMRFSRPWLTCEPALTEAFYLLGSEGAGSLIAFLRRGEMLLSFDLARNQDAVLALMEKYSDVPMSLADACLVRMAEVLPDPIVVTTDSHFQVYRRHSRQVIPCVMPE